MDRTHNIVATGVPIRVELGGNYTVEIFTITLINQPEGMSSVVHNAYIIDGAGTMELIALECPSDSTLHSITQEARQVITQGGIYDTQRQRGLSTLLDEIMNMDDN